jgi:hypothetical protein
MAQNPRSEEQNVTAAARESVRETARKGAEQTDRMARVTAEMSSEAARSSADLMERNVETMQRFMQSGAEMAARIAEQSAHRFNRALGLTGDEANRAARSSSGNLSAILRSSAVLAELTQDMALEWVHFSRDRVEQNLDRFDHLLGSRSPHDIFAMQSELMKSNLEGLLGFTRRAAERSLQVADELTRKFNEATEQTRRAA